MDSLINRKPLKCRAYIVDKIVATVHGKRKKNDQYLIVVSMSKKDGFSWIDASRGKTGT
jgi:hypothetical protein